MRNTPARQNVSISHQQRASESKEVLHQLSKYVRFRSLAPDVFHHDAIGLPLAAIMLEPHEDLHLYVHRG